MQRRPIATVITVTLAIALAGCGAADDASPAEPSALEDDAITVGSFDFAESRLLGEIYGQALEAAGYEVRRAIDLGPRELVAPALLAGLIEFVPEYAGSALGFVRRGAATPSEDPVRTRALLAQALVNDPVTVLEPAPAENANVFVVTRQAAEAGRPPHDQRPATAGRRADLRRPPGVLDPFAVPGGPRGHVRSGLRDGGGARRRRADDPPGIARRWGRRGSALHVGPGAR